MQAAAAELLTSLFFSTEDWWRCDLWQTWIQTVDKRIWDEDKREVRWLWKISSNLNPITSFLILKFHLKDFSIMAASFEHPERWGMSFLVGWDKCEV